MKLVISIFMVALFFLPSWSCAGNPGPASIRLLDGEAMFRTPENDEWLPAAVNTPLEEGDSLWCPEGSRMEIRLADGTVVRLDGGSQLELLAADNVFTHIYLASGSLYLRTATTMSDGSLQIDADNSTVLPAARTRLRIDMLPDGQEDVAIFKGSAYVEGNGNRTRVHAGEHIALDEGFSELLPLNPADSWERWNQERDRLQSQAAGSDSALPEELRHQAADLDSSGTWVTVPEYGPVWRPTVTVTGEWAPYRNGRWIWKGADYVWISYESWGWLPYHFGRWAIIGGFGWCWVPPARGDVYWGPGYVGWYTTGNYLGWTPLAPGEVYYGRKYYGRHSTNIATVNINSHTVSYRNRHQPGGVTVISHSDFLKGSQRPEQPSPEIFRTVEATVGSPRIRPQAETRIPLIRPISSAPPSGSRHDRRQLRARFPRVTPVPALPRHRQQPAAVTPVPAIRPAARPGQGVTPAAQPHQQTRPGSGPRPLPPLHVSQPLPRPEAARPEASPGGSGQPPVRLRSAVSPGERHQPGQSGRNGGRRRSPAPPAGSPHATAAPQSEASGSGESPHRAAFPATAPAGNTPRRGEGRPGELRQKRVWKVTMPENTGERERGHQGRERN